MFAKYIIYNVAYLSFKQFIYIMIIRQNIWTGSYKFENGVRNTNTIQVNSSAQWFWILIKFVIQKCWLWNVNAKQNQLFCLNALCLIESLYTRNVSHTIGIFCRCFEWNAIYIGNNMITDQNSREVHTLEIDILNEVCIFHSVLLLPLSCHHERTECVPWFHTQRLSVNLT